MTIYTQDGTKYKLSTGANGQTFIEFAGKAGLVTHTPHITRGHNFKVRVCLFGADGDLGEETTIESTTAVVKIN